MRDYRCPTCGGEFNHHNGACPFCGIKMGLHPYHEMTLINRVALEKATYRQSDRGTHPHKPEIKVELPPVSDIRAMGFGIDIDALKKDIQDHVDLKENVTKECDHLRVNRLSVVTPDGIYCVKCGETFFDTKDARPRSNARVMDSPYHPPESPPSVSPPKPKSESIERESEIKKREEKTKEIIKKK